MKRTNRRTLRARHRRGAVLIFVLASCVVAVSLIMLALQISLQQRRHLRSELQLEQTRWVLDAAIRKSIADPPDESEQIELKPKLEKFDKVLLSITPKQDGEQIAIRASIETDAGLEATSRSASFASTE